MVLVKNWLFFYAFNQGNIGQEKVFCDILKRKKGFLGYKNQFKISKTLEFSNSLVHGFGPKLAIFPSFFKQYTPGKCILP